MKTPMKIGKFRLYKLETAVILTGIVLLLIGNLIGASQNEETPVTKKPETASHSGESTGSSGYAAYYEAQIERLLKNIEGIKDVTAAVYVKSEGNGILAEDSNTDLSVTTESDSQGGSREEEKNVTDRKVVILKDAQGNETVVYTAKNAPEIAGIAVCVKGGASASVQEKIKVTLMALYDIPAAKISITG